MSVRVLGRVLAESEAEGASRLVLICLADTAHDDGITWVGQGEIAAKARISEGYVVECLKKLAAAGEVEVAKVQRGRKRINVYRLRFAVREIDHERLPFVLPEGALTTSESLTSSDEDDLRSAGSTTSDLPGFSGGLSISPSLNRKGNRKMVGASPLPAGASSEPPALVFIAGHNIALDVLMEECGVDAGNRQRVKWTVAALNGSPGQQGIRELFWLEATRWAEANGQSDRLGDLQGEPFEEALVKAIRRKADRYRHEMRGARLTPTALRSWWLDLEKSSGGGMTREEMLNFRG